MTTIIDLGQAHETYSGVKLVQLVSNPFQTSSNREKSKKTKAVTMNYKNQTKSDPLQLEIH